VRLSERAPGECATRRFFIRSHVSSLRRLTFQQVQKYEKGANRIGAARLQHLSQILQVPVSFFFEGTPASIGRPAAEESADAPSPSFVSDFLATSEGLDLVRAFTCIEDAKLRRAIVRLVEEDRAGRCVSRGGPHGVAHGRP
jgi:transcriptional regulator with XRE-family HTH domain